MTLRISDEQIQKLTHDSPEIRLRALESIGSALERSFVHNEVVVYNVTYLAMQLIRWFGVKPLQKPDRALELQLQLIRSPHAPVIFKRLKRERFRREIEKIRIIIGPKKTRCIELLNDLEALMQPQPPPESEDLELKRMKKAVECNSDTLTTLYSSSSNNSEYSDNDGFALSEDCYEIPWSKPSVTDITSMKVIADILINPFAKASEVEGTLVHLQITMRDYPPEYFLQMPHIFKKLLKISRNSKVMKTLKEQLYRTLLVYVKILSERVYQRRQLMSYAAPDTKATTQSTAKTQLKSEIAMQMLLNYCYNQLENNVCEFYAEHWLIMDLQIQALKLHRQLNCIIPENCIKNLGELSSRLYTWCADTQAINLPRLKYLLQMNLLQESLIFNYAKHGAVETSLFELLLPLTRDYALKIILPQEFQELKDCLDKVKLHEFPHYYNELMNQSESYKLALQYLQMEPILEPKNLLKDSEKLAPCIERLSSFRLIKILFGAITDCIALYIDDKQLMRSAEQLLLFLLNLRDPKLRSLSHKLLSDNMLKHFHCLLSRENFTAGCSNAQLASAQILGVPLTKSLLETLITLSHTDELESIQESCIDSLCLLIKSEPLLGQRFANTMELFIPLMPLLICRSCKHEELLRNLMYLHDPDTKRLPPLELMRGNICFLYHTDAAIRLEAINRLIFMLSKEEGQEAYFTDLTKDNLARDDICLIGPPQNYNKIFNTQKRLSRSVPQTMMNLIEVLNAKETEIVVRRTSLMQLNNLMIDFNAARAFCNFEAYVFPMTALVQSLYRKCGPDFKFRDCVLPSVSMLSKIFFVSKQFRNQMTKIPDLYSLLLRALLQYPYDLQMKQDASLCLFQLIFDDYINATESLLQMPPLVQNLYAPVTFNLEPPTKNHYDIYSISEATLLEHYFGANRRIEEQFWRLHIGNCVCKGYEHMKLSKLDRLDICDELKMRQQDIELVEATDIQLQLKRYLRATQDATDHSSMMKLIDVIQLYLLQLRNHSISETSGATMFSTMGKYIQLQPGNTLDYELYEKVLVLFDVCILQDITHVITALSNSLQEDRNHSFFMLLKPKDTPLRLYEKISTCFVHLLASDRSFASPSPNLWFGSAFDEIFQLAQEHFVARELQRVRCLLQILRQLSLRKLERSDTDIYQYCRQCTKLSSELKAYTQTGAQWQRDILFIVCQLHEQIEHPAIVFRFSKSLTRYLSGLCGHNDAQVRSLAWISLGNIVDDFKNAVTKKSNGKSSCEELLQELDFLPGGFSACCLSTMLDHTETMLTRQIAGNVFISLIKATPIENTMDLLERYKFLQEAHDALNKTQLHEELPNSVTPLNAGNMNSSVIISCYIQICIHMMECCPKFHQKLNNNPFSYKLYELLKVPPMPINNSFRRMFAHICELYARMYPKLFSFLQRSICRDPILIMSFVVLMNDMITVNEELLLANVIKLLIVLCKDDTSYWYMCKYLGEKPDVLVNLCLRTFDLQFVNTPLQRSMLSALSLMLIKTQTGNGSEEVEDRLKQRSSLLLALEQQTADMSCCDSTSTLSRDSEVFKMSQELNDIRIGAGESTMEQPLDTARTNATNPHSLKSILQPQSRCDSMVSLNSKNMFPNASVFIYMQLDRLFDHLYPLKSCKFTQHPTLSQVQVCEVLGVLLKLSPSAHEAAQNMHLLKRLLQILKNFHDDFNTAPITYIRRFGENKAYPILRNISLILQLIFHWHSSHHAVITDEKQAVELTHTIIRVWPWSPHCQVLKFLLMNTCAFLSEHSFVMCKQISTILPNTPSSVLQLAVKNVKNETFAVRAASTESCPGIEYSLRIMINCCACAEGRLSLVKLHILDVFDQLLSNTNKNTSSTKSEILHAWLRFWEVFSRYEQGSKACHIPNLVATVQRAPPRSTTRILCLRILRNMCFSSINRPQLIATAELMSAIQDIIRLPMHDADTPKDAGGDENGQRVCGGTDQPPLSYEEQRLVTVCLWKLFGTGAKYKAMLRGTKLAKHLRILREQLAAMEAEQPQRIQNLPYATELADDLDQMFEAIHN